MTAGGILPNYQRFVNGVPVPFSRKSFRPREKYVIFLVFITFGLVCFGTFFFLPEFKGSKSTADSVYKVYDKIKKAGPELLIPPPPHLEDDKDTLKLVRHDIDGQPDPHVIDDREKLKAKIEQDEQLKVLERPDMGLNKKTSSSTIRSIVKPLDQAPLRGPETNLLIKEGSDIITVPPAPSDHYPKTIGGEDEDPEARERRNKVKELVAGETFTIREFKQCDPNVHYINTIYASFYKIKGTYYLDGNATIKQPIDDDLRGKYQVHNVEADLNKISVKGLPYGSLQLKAVTTDKNENVVGCLIAVVDHIA